MPSYQMPAMSGAYYYQDHTHSGLTKPDMRHLIHRVTTERSMLSQRSEKDNGEDEIDLLTVGRYYEAAKAILEYYLETIISMGLKATDVVIRIMPGELTEISLRIHDWRGTGRGNNRKTGRLYPGIISVSWVSDGDGKFCYRVCYRVCEANCVTAGDNVVEVVSYPCAESGVLSYACNFPMPSVAQDHLRSRIIAKIG